MRYGEHARLIVREKGTIVVAAYCQLLLSFSFDVSIMALGKGVIQGGTERDGIWIPEEDLKMNETPS